MPVSPVDTLPQPLAVALHDAGAANIAIAWCAAAASPPERIWVAGPAEALWEARFGREAMVAGPEGLLDGARSLLSGTGWASDLEHRARVEAARRGIRSIAVIDHWVNFPARFERDGERQLPDEVWVGDEYALGIAERSFPNTRVAHHPNLYLQEQADRAGPVPGDGDILFVAEPARSDWGAGKPGEFQALDYFMSHRLEFGIPPHAAMRLRPHPSDSEGKFDSWIAAHEAVTLDRSTDLSAALRDARWVVGMNSMALVVAARSGRTAISALPPNAPPCVLPHEAIQRL